MNPLEWVSWVYGKLFANIAPIWWFVSVCSIAIIAGAILAAVARARYNDQHADSKSANKEITKEVPVQQINSTPRQTPNATHDRSDRHSPPHPTMTFNNAPGGFAISGGTVVNPSVINNAPPARTLKNEDHAGMVHFLSQKTGRIEILANMTSPEAYAYAKEWVDILKAAGWEVEGDGVGGFIPDQPWTGVVLTLHGEATQKGEIVNIPGNDPVAILGKALEITGNRISGGRKPQQPEGIIQMQIGLRP